MTSQPKIPGRRSVALALLGALALAAGCAGRVVEIGNRRPPDENTPTYASPMPPAQDAGRPSSTDGSLPPNTDHSPLIPAAAFHLVEHEWSIQSLAANRGWTFWIASTTSYEGSFDAKLTSLSSVRACRTNDCDRTLKTLAIPKGSVIEDSPGPVIAANATRVFWDMTHDGSVFATCPRPLCNTPGRSGFDARLQTFTVDDDRFYFINDESLIACSVDDCSSSARRFEMKQPAGARQFDGGYQLIADTDRLYMVDSSSLVSVAKEGQDTFDVITDELDTRARIAVSDKEIFWTDSGPLARIYACPKAGCAGGTRIVAQNLKWPGDLVVVGGTLYFVESPWMWSPAPSPPYGKDRISRCPVAGCDAPEMLLETDELNGFLVTDGEYVLYRGACNPPQGTPPADQPRCAYIGVLQ